MSKSALVLVLALVVPSPTTAGERIYPVGGDVLPPQRVSDCRPQIPESLRHEKITQPLFVYEVVISAAGKAVSVKLVRQNPKGKPYEQVERMSRQALERCSYRPATRKGKPVACRMLMTVTFHVQ